MAEAQLTGLDKRRLEASGESIQAQLASQQTKIEQLRAAYLLKKSQVDSLKVRAGTEGVLQQVMVEVGQRVPHLVQHVSTQYRRKLQAPQHHLGEPGRVGEVRQGKEHGAPHLAALDHHVSGQFQRQAGLAGASRPSEGDQPGAWGSEHGGKLPRLRLPVEELGGRQQGELITSEAIRRRKVEGRRGEG